MRRVKLKISEKRQALMDLAKLTRMMPADRVEHSGSLQHEYKLNIGALDHDQRDQLRALLLKARGPVTDTSLSVPEKAWTHLRYVNHINHLTEHL